MTLPERGVAGFPVIAPVYEQLRLSVNETEVPLIWPPLSVPPAREVDVDPVGPLQTVDPLVTEPVKLDPLCTMVTTAAVLQEVLTCALVTTSERFQFPAMLTAAVDAPPHPSAATAAAANSRRRKVGLASEWLIMLVSLPWGERTCFSNPDSSAADATRQHLSVKARVGTPVNRRAKHGGAIAPFVRASRASQPENNG